MRLETTKQIKQSKQTKIPSYQNKLWKMGMIKKNWSKKHLHANPGVFKWNNSARRKKKNTFKKKYEKQTKNNYEWGKKTWPS